MTDPDPDEQRYAQIEKQMLAIVHSCVKFDHFIYGRIKISVETDHKPLEKNFRKSMNECPRRLQRMLLFFQKYTLEVKYKRRSELYIADTLSRAYLNNRDEDWNGGEVLLTEMKLIEQLEATSRIPEIPNSNRRFEEIREATRKDPAMQDLIQVIRNGWLENQKKISPEIKIYYEYGEELVEENGMVLNNTRIIIPT